MKMRGVTVPAGVLVALIRVYKSQFDRSSMDPAAAKMFTEVHRLEYTATRKLLESKKEKSDE